MARKEARGRWAGYNNALWPRDLQAPRFNVPIFPGETCTEEEWDDYNQLYDAYEKKVEGRWRTLGQKPRYKNKKVNYFLEKYPSSKSKLD